MIIILILIIIYILYELWIYFTNESGKKIKKNKILVPKKINFQIPDKFIIPLSTPMKSDIGCHHYADIGMACPTESHNDIYDIMPFQNVKIENQEIIARHLQSEWGYKKNYTIDSILDEWPLIDALYVMTYNKKCNYKSNIIGCVAIDRKYFFPFISHLYVSSEFRGKGYGAVLIDFALKTVKILGFNKCKLWCDYNQINYYKKKGWIIEYQNNDLFIMSIQI
jgi:GNAT superfamily N-acetyltransferase